MTFTQWALGGVVLALFIGLFLAHEVASSKTALEASDAAAAQGAWPEAIAQARAAAETFVPMSPMSDTAQERLEAIAQAAERRGDAMTALLAFGSMRTAALATAAPTHDTTVWKARAEAGLSRLQAWAAAPQTIHPAHPRVEEGHPAWTAPNERHGPWVFAWLSISVAAFIASTARLVASHSGRAERVTQWAIALSALTYAIVLWTA